MDEPLSGFKSHTKGKNADVRIYTDRIEWVQDRNFSKGKAALGAATFGVSLAATGLKGGKSGTEMIPIASVSSVTSKRDGMSYTAVSVVTAGNTVDFRVPHKMAAHITNLLQDLMLGNHPTQQQSTTQQPTPAPVTQAAEPADDSMAKLERLMLLRDGGALTDEEFAAEKAKLLG